MGVRHRQQPFSPETLAERLRGLPPLTRYWLAYSGGCDSHVLLHAAAQLCIAGRLPAVHAVHVDHCLQSASIRWAQHCAAVCVDLGIPFTILRVDARSKRGESPEAAARQARYGAIAALMHAGDCLLTAHHQDDQAETLLLQLLRGGGPYGLAGMAEQSVFAAGMHARPLLGFSRDDLREYAKQQRLQWIDDPSNADSNFDRNYLRNDVMPSLRERWPAMARVLARGATHQAEAAKLLDDLAAQDLMMCQDEDKTLRIVSLSLLDEARQRNLLRYWLKHLGFKLPDRARLENLQQQMLHAAADRSPTVMWPGVTVRRYRGRLYAFPPNPSVDRDKMLPWDMQQPLQLYGNVSVVAVAVRGEGVKAALCRDYPVTVSFRRGGEECRPAPKASTRPLKKMLQELGVPPWVRERIPLVYVGERLAAVVGYWVCAPCQAVVGEEGICFELQYAGQDHK